ncbi:Protein root UVB sensitive 6 [Galdieria sulphuraria]|nr:Protein root UVB sensitive 6 [Galdieria sulphuraria]
MYLPQPHIIVSRKKLTKLDKGDRTTRCQRVSCVRKNVRFFSKTSDSDERKGSGAVSAIRWCDKQSRLDINFFRDHKLEKGYVLEKNRSDTIILWFRDLFRLDDHPALIEAVEEVSPNKYLLPVLIVPFQVNQSPQLLSVVLDLQASLRRRGSDLLVIENGDCARLRSIVLETGATKVYMTPCSETCTDFQLNLFLQKRVMDTFAFSGASLQLVSDNDRVVNHCSLSRDKPMSCPPTLPKTPNACSKWMPVFNDIYRSTTSSKNRSHSISETFARRKLDRLLKLLSCEDFDCFHSIFLHLCKWLQKELLLGVVSKIRIYFELRKHVNANYLTKMTWLRGTSASVGMLSIILFSHAGNSHNANASSNMIPAMAYDVEGSKRRSLEWDESSARFKLASHDEEGLDWSTSWKTWLTKRIEFLRQSFFPEGVSQDYYSFTMWRVFQRLVSSTVGVFGTQALLLALGIKAGRIGRAAATSWVLKDGLGRLGKMVWASQMGRDFDADPKRWRFRSALLYALGNGLEIVTQIFPASFLLFATLANSMKQISMLTASATRNAMYKNFAGRSENIADITAKGEAQIVVADLLGMALGIQLSKLIGTSRPNVLTAYSFLSVLDIYAIYKELRAVQFRTLNYERSSMIVDYFVRRGYVPRPDEVSQRENIFLGPRYDVRSMFASLSDAVSCPQELNSLIKIFKGEQFMVTRGWNGQYRIVLREHARNGDILRALLTLGFLKEELRQRKRLTWNSSKRIPFLHSFVSRMENDCWWSSSQIPPDDQVPEVNKESLRSSRQLNRVKKSSSSSPDKERLEEKLEAINCSYTKCKDYYQHFISQLHKEGWNADRLLYSPVKRRAVW